MISLCTWYHCHLLSIYRKVKTLVPQVTKPWSGEGGPGTWAAWLWLCTLNLSTLSKGKVTQTPCMLIEICGDASFLENSLYIIQTHHGFKELWLCNIKRNLNIRHWKSEHTILHMTWHSYEDVVWHKFLSDFLEHTLLCFKNVLKCLAWPFSPKSL